MPEQPWATEHTVHMFRQSESRAAAADSDGRRWMERRATELALVVCNCGLNTGWVPMDQLPSLPEILGRHGVPGA
ncbi:hypothetical protein [Streptomyces galilaeus]|uniref:Uncharacterized protein n=1 Tax=Streptomyces galilaeus TaxID=33899 RepID=A0ABW9IYE2_STRGJ